MENLNIIIAYAVYIPIVITMTVLVSIMLFQNGKVFMNEIFKGKEDMALATNKLLEIGFYLINIGYAFFIMKIQVHWGTKVISTQEIIEALTAKIGGFSIYLGIMLLFNLYLFFRGKRKSNKVNLLKPVQENDHYVEHVNHLLHQEFLEGTNKM